MVGWASADLGVEAASRFFPHTLVTREGLCTKFWPLVPLELLTCGMGFYLAANRLFVCLSLLQRIAYSQLGSGALRLLHAAF